MKIPELVIPRIMQRNKGYFLSLSVTFAILLLVIAYAGRAIFESEAEHRLRDIKIHFNADIRQVQTSLGNCAMQMRFIRDFQVVREYFEPASGHPGTGTEIQELLDSLIVAQPLYLRVCLLDAQGAVRLWSSGQPGGGGFSASGQNVLVSPDFQKQLMRLRGDDVFLSKLQLPVGAGPNQYPFVRMATPVLGAHRQTLGYLVFAIDLSRLMQQLSPDISILDDDGSRISTNPDGTMAVGKSVRPFPAAAGILAVSDTENILYATIAPLLDAHLLVAKNFSSGSIKGSLLKIVVGASAMFLFYFIIVLITSSRFFRQFTELERAQKAITHALANLSEWRDPETGSHLERTRHFSCLIARKLQAKASFTKIINDQFIEDLYDAAALHDIGKVGIRDDILLKPGKFTAAEFEIMKTHVLIGRDIHQDIITRFQITSSFIQVSKNIAHYHHEKFDGSGYPLGLRGEAIPLEARIFAIADFYDALRTKRPYKEGFSHEQTREMIQSGCGTLFDPELVAAFRECEEEFYEIYASYQLFDENYGQTMQLRSSESLNVQWREDLSIGVAGIDAQHQEFIRRINSLFAATVQGQGKEAALQALDFLHSYTIEHFGSEEAVMERSRYPDAAAHKVAHQLFLQQLRVMREEYLAGKTSALMVVHVTHKLVNWLVNHISRVDKKFGDHLKGEGEENSDGGGAHDPARP